MHMNTKHTTNSAKAMCWSVLTQIAPKLVTPIVNMILARLLAPEAFGAIATINIVITFAEIFTDAGFQKYLVQHEFESNDELNNATNVAFWTNILVSAFFVSGIFIFRNPIASFVGNPDLGGAIAVSSINIFLVTLSSTQTARYNRSMDFKTLFYARICTVLIPLIVTVPLAILMRNYWALIIGTLITNFLHMLILTAFSKWKPKLYFSAKLFKDMIGFSSWLLLDAIAIWFTAYIGSFIVGRQMDDYYLGLYKTSITTVNSITGIITMAIAPVMFSELSRFQDNDVDMKAVFYKYQRLSAIILIPLSLGIFVFKDLVTWILLGDQWLEATGFIGIWGLISTISILFTNFCSTYYRSKGKPKIALLTQIAFLVVLIPSIILSVKHGFEALYYTRSFVLIIQMILYSLVMKFVFDFKLLKMILNILPMVISAIVMGIIGYALKSLMVSYAWNLICVAICVLVYFLVLFLFPKIRREMLSIPFIDNFLRNYDSEKAANLNRRKP